MSQELVLISGYPAAGKTSLTASYEAKGYVRLNRDTEGGSVANLVPKLKPLFLSKKSVVADNLFATKESRRPFIEEAQKHGIPVRCVIMDTSFEDAQFNACLRMVERAGRILDPKEKTDDPNLFPVAVMYKYRKEYEKPTLDEGFTAIEKVGFKRKNPELWKNKAIIVDYDGTLRETKSGSKFPVDPSDITILPRRTETLKRYKDQGYLILGVSNQSGIAKKQLTHEMAVKCFDRTNELLGVDIDVRFCPHSVPPITCFCRKPGPGLGVALIIEYKLDPAQCIMVGDMTTDKTFAARCGFKFVDQDVFFK